MYAKKAIRNSADYANHTKEITPGETPSEKPVDSKKRAEQAPEKITTNDIKEEVFQVRLLINIRNDTKRVSKRD